MPVDFRYHLASLLAVFCALLIGILLGIALVGDPALEAQLRAFREERAKNRETITRLSTSDRQRRAFAKQVLPYLIDARLKGVSVAVILNRDVGKVPWVEEVITNIGKAEGQVTSVTSVLPAFLKLQSEEAAQLFADFGFMTPVEGDVRSVLAGKLAVHIAEGSSELPFRLRQLGLIGVEGNYARPSDSVVLIGGTDTDLSAVNVIDLPVIRALQEAGKRVIACEATTNSLSCMPRYQRRDISTIDHLDTSAGQFALVLVLAGAKGDFGVKSTADQLLPPIPELAR